MANLSQQQIEAYLSQPHVGHLVTVRPDGRPHVAPIWFLWENGHAFVFTGDESVKVRNIRRNPAVSLCIATDQPPYQYVILEGQARLTRENMPAVVERLFVHYQGPERGPAMAREMLGESGAVLVDLRVDRVLSFRED